MDLTLPALGEGADSGTVVNLFVKEGDLLAKDGSVLELENEKAVATIPSPTAGKISKIFVKIGDKISVGQRILSLQETGTPEKAEAPAGEGQKHEPEQPAPEAKPGVTPAMG